MCSHRRFARSAILSVSGAIVGIPARLLSFTRSAIDGSGVLLWVAGVRTGVVGREMMIVGAAGVAGDGSCTLGSGWAACAVCSTLGIGAWGNKPVDLGHEEM